VLENQLLLIVGLKHQGVLIETLDPAGELDAAHQVDRENDFILAGVV
jgi:hypothetical protein